jgi:transposase
MEEFLELPWQDEDVTRLVGDIGQRIEWLYTFVRIPGTSWNSNEAEREVRVAVVARKISGGRRTGRGAWVLERILSVWRTWKKRGRSFRDVTIEKLGAPQAGPGPLSTWPAS